jgi:hypothetical protein
MRKAQHKEDEMRSRLRSIALLSLSLAAAVIVTTRAGLAVAQEPAAPVYEPTATPPAPEPAALAPAPAPAPAAPSPAAEESKPAKPLVGYDKGFFIQDGEGLFKLVIGARVQGRFTYESVEGHRTNADGDAVAATAREDGYQFSLPQVRLKLAGHVFSERVAYLMQADFGNKGYPALIAAYGDFALVPGALHLRVGQWERPFSRQQITSSGSFHLVDRAITDKAFGCGRDLGIAFHNDYEK